MSAYEPNHHSVQALKTIGLKAFSVFYFVFLGKHCSKCGLWAWDQIVSGVAFEFLYSTQSILELSFQ